MPTLVMHGDDDQIVPMTPPVLSAKLVKNASSRSTLASPTACRHSCRPINPDLLAFIKS